MCLAVIKFRSRATHRSGVTSSNYFLLLLPLRHYRQRSLCLFSKVNVWKTTGKTPGFGCADHFFLKMERDSLYPSVANVVSIFSSMLERTIFPRRHAQVWKLCLD